MGNTAQPTTQLVLAETLRLSRKQERHLRASHTRYVARRDMTGC